MRGDAVFDPSGTYRYRLRRRWSRGPAIAFVMLNPNRADAVVDDPTIRRCVGFARRWGYGAIEVTNLFAYRARHPRELRMVDDPIGPENDRHIAAAAARADLVVCAWGAAGALEGRDRAVRRLLRGVPTMCLGRTREGFPRHPLYVPRDARPARFARQATPAPSGSTLRSPLRRP